MNKRLIISLLIIFIIGMIIPNIALADFNWETCMNTAKGMSISQLEEAIKKIENAGLGTDIVKANENQKTKEVYQIVLNEKKYEQEAKAMTKEALEKAISDLENTKNNLLDGNPKKLEIYKEQLASKSTTEDTTSTSNSNTVKNKSVEELKQKISELRANMERGIIPRNDENLKKLAEYEQELIDKQGLVVAGDKEKYKEEAYQMSIDELKQALTDFRLGMERGIIPRNDTNNLKLSEYENALIDREGITTPGSITNPVINPDDYKPTIGDNSDIADIGNGIVGVIKVVGSIVSVGALVIMGIKYMFGSIESKAEYKKVMIPYIIGAVLLFASSHIVGFLYDYFQKITG